MLVAGVLSLATLAFVPAASAWQGCADNILQALEASGLDRFANATGSLNGTSGQYVLTELLQGNKLVFAPTDNALSGVNIQNGTSLADLIAYHIVTSNLINETATYPNVTIARTLLNDSNLVMLEGNKSQVLAWSQSDNGSVFVLNQGSNVSVVNTTTYDNTTILAIDSVLTPPPNISTILNNQSYDLTSVATFLNSTNVPNGPSLLDVLSSAHGITVFAPNNAGVQAAQGSLSGIANNSTAFADLISNHIINGTSVYSTELSDGTTYISAAGQKLALLVNSTGTFVSAGGSNQVEIVQPNVLASNGVVHVVNGVMLDTDANAGAASTAYAAATFVAAHTTETGAITASAITAGIPTTTGSATAGSTESSTSTETSTSSESSTGTSSSTGTPASTSSSAPSTTGGTTSGKVNNWKVWVLMGVGVGLTQLL